MSSTADLRVLRPRAGAVVVECRGAHDRTTRARLDRLLDHLVARNELVVVDVTEAEFVDSSFLHSLVKADRAARRCGTRFRLQLGTAPIVRRAFEASRLLEHLDWAETREAVLIQETD